MPVAAQRGPCEGSVLGRIGCASYQRECNKKRELDRMDHAATYPTPASGAKCRLDDATTVRRAAKRWAI
jgi:hypothetical protein